MAVHKEARGGALSPGITIRQRGELDKPSWVIRAAGPGVKPLYWSVPKNQLSHALREAARHRAGATEKPWTPIYRAATEALLDRADLIEPMKAAALVLPSRAALPPEGVLLQPAEPKYQLVTHVSWHRGWLCLRYPEPDDDFRDIARSVGCQWDRPHWAVRVGDQAIEDRTAEVAARLLDAGFPVLVPSSDVAEMVRTGTFTTTPSRWVHLIDQGVYNGWFAFDWLAHEDWYDAAKALPGSAYSKPFVVVPPDQFEEVTSFAEINDFRMTPEALDLVEAMRGLSDEAWLISELKLEEGSPLDDSDKTQAQKTSTIEHLLDD